MRHERWYTVHRASPFTEAAHQYDGVFLQVVPFTRNVTNDFQVLVRRTLQPYAERSLASWA